MAELPGALKAALDAYYGTPRQGREVRSPVSSRRGLTARLRDLERAYGGRKEAAAVLGVPRDTVTRWINGTRGISAANQAKVQGAHDGLSRALSVRKKGAPLGFTIHAVVVCNAAPRNAGSKANKARNAGNRYVNAHNSGTYRHNAPSGAGYRPFRADALTASQRQDVATAYAAGRSARHVADVLVSAINRQYPEPFSFEGRNVIVEIR